MNTGKCTLIEDVNLYEQRSLQQKQHLSECESCCIEQKLFNELNVNEPENLLEPLDDISTQRIINNTLSLLNSEKLSSLKKSGSTVSYKKYAFLAASVLIVLAGVFILTSIKNSKHHLSDRMLDDFKGINLISDIGFSINTPGVIEENTLIKTGDHPLVFSLGKQFRIVLFKESAIRLVERNSENIVFRMEKGGALHMVNRENDDPQYEVIMKNSRIKVKGTIFSTQYSDNQKEVTVLRGKVQVTNLAGDSGMYVESGKTWYSGLKNKVDTNSEIKSRLAAFSKLIVSDLSAEYADKSERKIAKIIAVDKKNVSAPVNSPGDKKAVSSKKLHKTVSPKESESVIKNTTVHIKDNKKINENSKTEPSEIKISPVKKTPSELFREARNLRIKSRWSESEKVYLDLITRYPENSLAKVALVVRGNLLLNKLNRPSEAVKSFRKYISLNGSSLAQEAHWGIIRGLRVLGKKSMEIIELNKFLKIYPSSLQREKASSRLNQLKSGKY
ncbi:MAG: FecR domain-containing protein [Deltaproteobacteria bacterium]|nr:FecR domain-containing protein [Deltaproteobacteria bacterium]